VTLASGSRLGPYEILAPIGAGVGQVATVVPTSDGRSFVYSYIRQLSDLYVLEKTR